jgi:glutamate dehydrogenase
MTSLSVRQYILGVLKAHGLNEKDVTKFQTGGPDGDLGSNEILLSKDKTVAIIDGSGVLYDPVGLDRPELIRLAKARSPISGFDKSKLSPEGYRVLVDEQDIKLPSGEIIPDGTELRNNFHFRVKADLFVPCGGRPEAVNISNVNLLIDTEGKPNFKYVVEGANLFFTQQARLFLERKGVVLFKDSSTNKVSLRFPFIRFPHTHFSFPSWCRISFCLSCYLCVADIREELLLLRLRFLLGWD